MLDSTSGTMETKTTSWTDPVSARSRGVLRSVEGGIGQVGQSAWEVFHELPYLGAIIGGGLGLGAAMLVGVGELATAALTAYVGYRVFAYGESFTKALEKSIRLQEGKLAEKEIGESTLKK